MGFLVVLSIGHVLFQIKGSPGRTLFLDKTCIHQVDKDLQKQGILKLGAFIRKSLCLLVIYSDLYLIKLWTVYEVACFLCLHPLQNMSVVPTFLPFVFLCGLATVLVGVVLDIIAEVTSD